MYHLFLHEVDLIRREDVCKFGPMLVFQRPVVEVLGGADKGSKEDAMPRAWHTLNQVSGRMYGTWSGMLTLSHGRELKLEAVEVYEGD